LISENITTAQMPLTAPAWARLSEAERIAESKKMEIYAAMISDLDTHVGEILDYLESAGKLDSTIIVFLSDNGPEGSLFEATGWPVLAQWVEACCDNSLQNMGRASSYLWTGPGWAWGSAAPHRGAKGSPFEGGLKVPAIIRYPGHAKAGLRSDAFLTIMDIMPTLLEGVEVQHPGEQFQERSVLPMRGKSMWPVLAGVAETVHAKTDSFGWELWGQSALRRGDWKLVVVPLPGTRTIKLFNLDIDPAEMNDLSAIHPERVNELEEQWRNYATEVGFLPVDWWDKQVE